jgi:hypothetical protein
MEGEMWQAWNDRQPILGQDKLILRAYIFLGNSRKADPAAPPFRADQGSAAWSASSCYQIQHSLLAGLCHTDFSMIKKIESYKELADPQLQPRYSGIPTFFRLPHGVRLDQVDVGVIGVPFRRCHQPLRRTSWPARGAQPIVAHPQG